MRQILNFAKMGWPNNVDISLSKYFSKKDEFSVKNNCLLRNNRVVIPEKLKSDVLKILHKGHPGIVRSKLLARSYVWWIDIDKDIESHVNSCNF